MKQIKSLLAFYGTVTILLVSYDISNYVCCNGSVIGSNSIAINSKGTQAVSSLHTRIFLKLSCKKDWMYVAKYTTDTKNWQPSPYPITNFT